MKSKLLLVFFILQNAILLAQYAVDLRSINIPKEMNADDNYQLYVIVKNTGEGTLNRSNCTLEVTYESGPDKKAGENFEYEHDLVLNLETNDEYTFRWTVKSPTIPGFYKLKIKIMQGSSILKYEYRTIEIEENYQAEFTINMPSSLVPEKEYPDLKVTVKNTGDTTWPEGKYEIETKVKTGPSRASKEDEEAFEFTKEIELSNYNPNAKKESTLTDEFETPTTGGNYVLSVKILKDGKLFNAKNAEFTTDAFVKVEEQKVTITEKVTTKIYPEKEYSVSFDVKNSGKLKWDKGKYKIKATLLSKPSNAIDDKVFEAEVDFSASEWDAGESTTVNFPKIKAPIIPGKCKVKYEILKDGKTFEIDDTAVTIYYEIVELLPELNIGRITLDKKMRSGKTYKLRLDVKNYGDIIAIDDDWEVRCKIRSKKPSNYKPPRGVFDFKTKGIEIKASQQKYVSNTIKIPKVAQETKLRLQFQVYHKGKSMGGQKTYDIIITP